MYQLTEQDKAEIIANRRYLHMYPEVSDHEAETAVYICRKLEEYGIPYRTTGVNGVVGELTFGGAAAEKGPIFALRADIDALPVLEATGVDYASRNEGIMHACGHDGHMAVLLGAARKLGMLAQEEKAGRMTGLCGTVRFVFQPAEEKGSGGAISMLQDASIMEGVSRVLCFHMCPTLPAGKFSVRSGECSAGTDRFKMIVHGRSSHAAMPHMSIDAINAACQIVTTLQSVVSRNLNPVETGVISIGHFEGGKTYNVLADTVMMEGTIRAFNPGVRELLIRRLTQVANSVAEACEASVDITFADFTGPVINDPTVASEVEAIVRREFGDEAAEMNYPKVMLGDDFSEFQAKAPGMYIWAGCSDGEGSDTCYSLHHPRFNMNEESLWKAATIYVQYVKEYLHS